MGVLIIYGHPRFSSLLSLGPGEPRSFGHGSPFRPTPRAKIFQQGDLNEAERQVWELRLGGKHTHLN